MKKIVLIFFIVLSLYSLYGQDITPNSYDGIPKSMKKRIFIDNFDNNNYSWIRKNSPPTHRIKDGFLYFSNEYDFPYVDGKAISFDDSKNWEIETRIKFISGDVEAFNGLMWGQLIFGKKYVFSFSSIGYVQVDVVDGYDNTFLLKPQKTQIVNKTAGNDLIVRKYGNKYYLFFNKVLVYTSDFESLPGQYIGFSVSPNSMIRIDFLRLWYIE